MHSKPREKTHEASREIHTRLRGKKYSILETRGENTNDRVVEPQDSGPKPPHSAPRRLGTRRSIPGSSC